MPRSEQVNTSWTKSWWLPRIFGTRRHPSFLPRLSPGFLLQAFQGASARQLSPPSQSAPLSGQAPLCACSVHPTPVDGSVADACQRHPPWPAQSRRWLSSQPPQGRSHSRQDHRHTDLPGPWGSSPRHVAHLPPTSLPTWLRTATAAGCHLVQLHR